MNGFNTLVLALVMAAAPADEQALIDRVENSFAAVKSMTADFTQKTFDATTGDVTVARGRVLIKKPLRMKWQYAAPDDQWILSDGEKIFFYTPADRQVMVEELGNILNSRSPALFLAGNAELRELFRINLAEGPDEATMSGTLRLVLTPRQESLNATRITVTARRADGQVTSFSIHDWSGNRTDVFFSDIETNVDVDDNAFRFEKPDKAEIIELPSMDF